MSKVKWTRQTPNYWVAKIHGCDVNVKKWRPKGSNGCWCYKVTFYPEASSDTPWSCGYPSSLRDAKAAAEQMAQVWAATAATR